MFEATDFELRRNLRDTALRKIKNRRPDKSGRCMLCLAEVKQLEGSHTGSRAATAAFYGKKKQAAFFFHDVAKESGDNFQILLFCDDCEDKFREKPVMRHLKAWGGLLPTTAMPQKPLESGVLFHFANALFMKQLSVSKWEEHAWTTRIFKALIQFVQTNHHKHQHIADLPEVAFFLTKPGEDLWASQSYSSNELKNRLASSLFMGTRIPFMNFEAKREHFIIDEGVLEYHFADWHFYMKEANSSVCFPEYILQEHMLIENRRTQLRPRPSNWPTALLDAELRRTQTSEVGVVTDEFRASTQQRFQILSDVGTPLEQWVKLDYKFYQDTIVGHIKYLCQAGRAPPAWTQRSWELKVQRLEQAQTSKNDGNTHFRADRLAEALQAYKASLLYIKGYASCDHLPGIDSAQIQEQNLEAVSLSQTCLVNEAAVHIRLRNGKEALGACSVVLIAKPENTKALYRRALAYQLLENLSLAKDDCDKGMQLEPDNRAWTALKSKLQACERANEQKLCRKMFRQPFQELRN